LERWGDFTGNKLAGWRAVIATTRSRASSLVPHAALLLQGHLLVELLKRSLD
jgi:hypothetical protein